MKSHRGLMGIEGFSIMFSCFFQGFLMVLKGFLMILLMERTSSCL